MISDALVSFIGLNTPLSLVGGAGVVFPSPIFDLMGTGVGTPPPNIIGNRSVWGQDPGVGLRRVEFNIVVGTGLTGTAGTTLRAALQGAVDTGAGGNYQPGSWVDIWDQDGIGLANVSGGAGAGAVIARFPFLPTMPPGLNPRFFRLLFSPQSGGVTPAGSFMAGTIASALGTMVRDDQANKYGAPNNYVVA